VKRERSEPRKNPQIPKTVYNLNLRCDFYPHRHWRREFLCLVKYLQTWALLETLCPYNDVSKPLDHTIYCL